MNIIKLTDPKYFKWITYPDNQISLTLTDEYLKLRNAYELDTIYQSIASYTDLIRLLTLKQLEPALHELNLIAPYIFASRSDKQVVPNSSIDVKIVADIINSCNFKSVTVYDPHSAVTSALINNCNPVSLESWARDYILENWTIGSTYLISPDIGAYHKTEHIVQSIRSIFADFTVPDAIVFHKTRNSEGHISFDCPNIPTDETFLNKTFIICDDLIDGGMTFTLIANGIKKVNPNSTVILIVTHGLFSKGIDLPNIDKIYVTDSIETVRQYPESSKFIIHSIF